MNQNRMVFCTPSGQSLHDAHGKIPFNMTNDYMFRAVLQSNNKVLRGLTAALLHLPESEIRSVAITNPIILGVTLACKEIRLDVNVILNDNCGKIDTMGNIYI